MFIIILLAVFYVFLGNFMGLLFRPTASDLEQGTALSGIEAKDVEVIASNLDVPWEIAFLPNGEILVTERSGNLLKIGKDRQAIRIEGVYHSGESGLLGLTLHPEFSENNLVYLYLTSKDNEVVENRVERYKLVNSRLVDRKIIIDGIPGSQFHDGGRIAFGPDNLLYITTGDAGTQELAQDKTSLAGKILRITDSGEIPDDNPFNNAVYSYGHRNSQGIAWDSNNQLWATEHGRSGLQSGLDELNMILPGRNYGWSVIQGDETREGMEAPVINSGSDVTWAPADALYYNGSIFFTGLRGQALYQALLDGNKIGSIKAHFRNEFGRIRVVNLGPDGYFYIATSNTDGRGNIKAGDDKIIRINPEIFYKNG